MLSTLEKQKRNVNVVRWISKQETLVFSVISFHELRYGISRAKKEQKKKLENWWNSDDTCGLFNCGNCYSAQ
jgi:predicted nucleic acid-binding protein